MEIKLRMFFCKCLSINVVGIVFFLLVKIWGGGGVWIREKNNSFFNMFIKEAINGIWMR